MVGGPAMVGRPGGQQKMAPPPPPGRHFLLAPHIIVRYIIGYIIGPIIGPIIMQNQGWQNPGYRFPRSLEVELHYLLHSVAALALEHQHHCHVLQCVFFVFEGRAEEIAVVRIEALET